MAGSGEIHRIKLDVELELRDGTRVIAAIALRQQQPLTDVLNSTDPFLQVELAGGRPMYYAKGAIASIGPLGVSVAEPETDDPYRALGIGPAATDEQIKEAYHAISRRSHPDMLRGMGLPPEFVSLATRRMAAINDAYARIRKQRGLKQAL